MLNSFQIAGTSQLPTRLNAIGGTRKSTFILSVLFVLVAGLGCTPADRPSGPPTESGGHSHAPPHGGVMTELGDHAAQLEIVHDAESGTLTLYAFDGHADMPLKLGVESIFVEIEPESHGGYIPLELRGVANSLTGETTSDTSQFSVTDEELKQFENFRAVIPMVVVRGVSFEEVVFEHRGGLR